MPIISSKNNPPSKSFEGSILENKGTWWVAKTRPRQEKTFAFDLLEQGIDYYLPFYEKKSKRSDGKLRKSTLILFPSYVPFISEKPFELLKNNRIATILPIKAQQKFKSEIHQIYIVSTCGLHIEPVSLGPLAKVGDSIEIIAGPLCGGHGTISEITKNKVVIIFGVETLGSAKIVIDAFHIRKI